MKIIKAPWVSHDGMPIFSVDIHPDNSRFVTGGQGTDSGLVIIWNLKPVICKEAELDENVPKMLCQLDSHLACVNCVRWSSSGKYLASAGDDKLTMIWKLTKCPQSGNICFGSKDKINVETWRCVNTLRGHSGDILDIAWSPEDMWLATASVDNTVIIWDATKLPTVITILKEHTGLVKGVAWDPIGKYLSTQSEDKSLKIWRTFDWKLETAIKKPFKKCSGMTEVLRHSWSPDGQYIITAHAMNETAPTSQIVERDGWKYKKDFVGHKKAITCAKFSGNIVERKFKPNNNKTQQMCLCALGSRDSSISIWLTGSVRPIVAIQEIFQGPVLDLSWSSGNNYLFGCSFDGTIVTMMFNEDEIGKPLSSELKNELFEKMYGTSAIGYRKEKVHIIENPGLLHLLEETNKREQKNLFVQEEREKKSSSSSTNPAVRFQTPARIVTKQIETRTKDGKRRITPVYIPPVMDEDDESELVVDEIKNSTNVVNCTKPITPNKPKSSDGENVEQVNKVQPNNEATNKSNHTQQSDAENTSEIKNRSNTEHNVVTLTNEKLNASTINDTRNDSIRKTTSTDNNNDVIIKSTEISTGDNASGDSVPNNVIGFKRKISQSRDNITSSSNAVSDDVIRSEKKPKFVNTDENCSNATREETKDSVRSMEIETETKINNSKETNDPSTNVTKTLINDVEVLQFASVLENRMERINDSTTGTTNSSSVSEITPSIAQNIEVFNNIFRNSRKNKDVPTSNAIEQNNHRDEISNKIVSSNSSIELKDKYGGRKPSNAAVNLLAAKKPKFMDKSDNNSAINCQRDIVNETTHPAPVKLPRMRLNIPTTINITSRCKLLISGEVGFNVNSKFYRIKMKIDDILSWEYAYGYEIIGCSFNDTILTIALSNRHIYLLNVKTGKMIFPPIIMSAPASVLHVNGVYLICVTCDAIFNMWDLENFRAVITGQSLTSILTPTNGKEDVTVKKIALSTDGVPMLLLSTGNSFLFSRQINSWISIGNNNDPVTLCSLQRVRQNNIRATASDIVDKLPLFTLQSYASFTNGSRNRVTLAQNSDMADVCTVTFLEQQTASSMALKSAHEYRYWLLALVRFLLQHGKLQRLRSICEELLGPVHECSSDRNETITILGMNKHALLKEILQEIGSNIRAQRLFTEFNDQLNAMSSDK